MKTKAFSTRSLHSIWPAPIAVAEFAGGETIRMSFWQPAGKPWRFAAARRLLAQTIGNERAREGATAESLKMTTASEQKIKALYDRPGTDGEKAAAGAALKRKQLAAKKIMAALAIRLDNLARYNAHPPATDFVTFYVEQDGRRIEPNVGEIAGGAAKRIAAPRKRTATVASEQIIAIVAAPKPLDAMLSEMESQLGDGFLETKAWRRVRARVAALTRQPEDSIPIKRIAA